MLTIVVFVLVAGMLPSLSEGQCGASPMSRVIGGVDAQPGAWPWQVALYKGGRFICGGSLIKKDWLVTAAHCVTHNMPSRYYVRLGDHNRDDNQEGTEQFLRVKKIISHPQYGKPYKSNDIALIQLTKPATLNSRVGLVCLPNQGYNIPPGSNCYITGWGKIKHPGNAHHILQQAHMPPVSEAECIKKNGKDVNKYMVCAGKSGTVTSGCHGDSGGPYVCKNSAGQWVLQGAVSWGSSTCDISYRYTVFARVSQYRSWIEKHTNGVSPPVTSPPTRPPPTRPPPTRPPPTRPPPTGTPACRDNPKYARSCPGWAKRNYCRYSFVKRNCKKSCKLC